MNNSQFPQQYNSYSQYSYAKNNIPLNIPAQYKPISAWGYIGYSILFSIPIVGLIMLIVYALSDENINRRNYARSFFCAFLLGLIIGIIIIAITFIAIGIGGY